ncbi:Nramp family divalent metal transporter [Niveibacterium sp. SC-1]|uniref:Nramp family divalent metal transporter n=1 Tax=Niveibacterium sp. SC-1 TaxID=3135646 RepID=UPI00311E94B3
MFSLPRTATAPFCPSEVRGSIDVPAADPQWKRLLRVLGPGLLVSVGYMDPGNWATDIEAGSRYGYALLWVVLASSIAAMLLQTLSLRLGLVTGKDLARACRDNYPPAINRLLWIAAELAIIACDVAEVLGSALALHLLFGMSLLWGIAITAFDTLIVLGLKGKGFRQVEAIVLGLILTIGICYAVEIVLVGPDLLGVARGFVPRGASVQDPHALLLAIGILGATVMPHNLYLHSSIVQTRRIGADDAGKREAIRLSTLDTVLSLSLALFVNVAILVLAASAFHATGHQEVTEIQDAYKLLDPLVGGALASLLFGVALLAAGQSSTFTGTIAGQILMEGFLDLKIPCWQRRLITRALALIPAFAGILWLGEAGVGRLLVASQVVLSLQLPFAIWPLIRFTSDRRLMGRFASGPWLRGIAWLLFAAIAAANLMLLRGLL